MNVSATRLVLLVLGVVLISCTEPAAALGQNFVPSKENMAEAAQRVADAANSPIGSGQVQQALADAEKAEGGDSAETEAADEPSADESAEATAEEDTQATAEETADEDTQATADEDTPADEESSEEDASDEE